ncbi:thioredoxin TrxC [Methylorubrum populi]|uniref:Thioredoxin n=1 Tax=Methylorubrum populi TaxID=223967 RepID=A0A833IZR4_9HYPH|nr:thioredoxin TrxC [Methylorubrum populi]KAB7781837.1 Thioredoxin [Methylorubrum populi]
MSEMGRHIVCPHCASINRVPLSKPAKAARCGRCKQALFTGHPVSIGSAHFDQHIQRNDIPVVVDFWAEWCGPCKAMAPVFEQLSTEFEPEFRFLKVDTEAEQELAARYGIRSIPTMILFWRGAEFARRAGAVNTDTLRAWLRQHKTR